MHKHPVQCARSLGMSSLSNRSSCFSFSRNRLSPRFINKATSTIQSSRVQVRHPVRTQLLGQQHTDAQKRKKVRHDIATRRWPSAASRWRELA
jgi:hypothetical protein